MVREPRSAHIAEPPAPAISSAVTIGLACWMIASTLAAPVKDCAPICVVSEPRCSAMTAPNGIETSAVGRIDTLAMNQNCWTNSRNWNGRRKMLRITSRPSAYSLPVSRIAPAPGNERVFVLIPAPFGCCDGGY